MLRSLAFLLTLGAFTLLSPRALADFTSTFDIPVGNGTYHTSGSVGAWSLSLVSGGGPALLNTGLAPSSISLSGCATGPGSGSSATLEFPSLAQGGMVSVDFDFSATTTSGDTSSTATFAILVNGSAVASYSTNIASTAVFSVLPGDNFAFYVSGAGGIINPTIDPVTHIPNGPPTILTGTGAVTLSNFTFSPVPEPSATAAIAGVLTLGAAAAYRRRWSRGK